MLGMPLNSFTCSSVSLKLKEKIKKYHLKNIFLEFLSLLPSLLEESILGNNTKLTLSDSSKTLSRD